MGWANYAALWHGGMLIVQVQGLLTLARVTAIRLSVREELRRRSAVKVLVDLRRAVFAFGDGALDALAAGDAPEAAVAFLVDPAQAPLTKGYARRMLEAGRTRLVFTRLSPSLWGWLGGQVPVLKELPQFQPVAPPPPQTPPRHTAQ